MPTWNHAGPPARSSWLCDQMISPGSCKQQKKKTGARVGPVAAEGAQCAAVRPCVGTGFADARSGQQLSAAAKLAALPLHDVKQRNLSCRICVGAGDAPLNGPFRFRGASAPRFDPFVCRCPQPRGCGAPTRRTRLKWSRRQDATATFARRGRTLRGCARLSALRMAVFGAGPLCISGVAAGSVARVARGRESCPASGVPNLPSRRSLPPSRTPLPLRLQDRLRRRPSSSRMDEL